MQAVPDPLTTITWQTWIEMNVKKAKEMGLKEGDVVTVESSGGTIEAIVYPHPAVPPDVVGIPIGQGHTPGLQYSSREGEKRGDNVISILAMEKVAETGALAWAANRVRVQPTGRNVKVSKLEGLVTAFPIGTRAEDIVQVTSSTDA
jgi:molybdopterin-containing oxidoreductase family iron-sulfur binding subunit